MDVHMIHFLSGGSPIRLPDLNSVWPNDFVHYFGKKSRVLHDRSRNIGLEFIEELYVVFRNNQAVAFVRLSDIEERER